MNPYEQGPGDGPGRLKKPRRRRRALLRTQRSAAAVASCAALVAAALTLDLAPLRALSLPTLLRLEKAEPLEIGAASQPAAGSETE